jgi:hypothetical protein
LRVWPGSRRLGLAKGRGWRQCRASGAAGAALDLKNGSIRQCSAYVRGNAALTSLAGVVQAPEPGVVRAHGQRAASS